MKMHSTLICDTFLSPQSIRLGRFVRNIDEPQSDFFDADCEIPSDSILIKHQHRYNEVQRDAKERSFTATLTSLLSTSRTKRNKTSIQVSTDQVKTYQLSNSGSWFKSAVKSEAARERINESIDDGDDIYLIVGYHTITDARIVEGIVDEASTSAWLKLPVGEALATAGIVVPLGNLVDPGFGVQNSHQQGTHRRFVAVGEQVCAVQYRKVRFKWFSSRDLEKSSLDKINCWKVYWSVRGQEIGTNDVLEVDLQEDLDLENEDHERHMYGEEQFFI